MYLINNTTGALCPFRNRLFVLHHLISRFLSILFLTLALSAHAVDYWISYNVGVGNDTNTGISPSNAWYSFKKINRNGPTNLSGATSDTVHISVTNTFDGAISVWYQIYLPNITNTSSNHMVTFTNWGPGRFSFTNSNTDKAGGAIYFTNCSWVRVVNWSATNGYRGVEFDSVTNFEIGGWVAGYAPGTVFKSAPFNIGLNSQSNWIHNYYCGPAPGGPPVSGNPCTDGGTDCLLEGGYYLSDGVADLTGFNIIEDGTNEFDGHAGLELAGHNDYVQNIWCLNYPWYEATWCPGITNETFTPWEIVTMPTWWGGREISLGGAAESNTVFQNFHIDYCGWVPDQPGALDVENGGNNIVREGEISCASGVGLMAYGGTAGAGLSGSNVFYNISVALCASNITFYTNGDLVQASYPEYQYPLFSAASSNNAFVNVLVWGNYTNTNYISLPGTPTTFANQVQDWRGNMTNTNPHFVSLSNSIDKLITNSEKVVYPNLDLEAGSPAIAGGTWLAYISTFSESGTSFTVYSNANYFSTGLTACTRYISGDTIAIQDLQENQSLGAPPTAVITSIVGNTITITDSLGVYLTNGEGNALPCTGARPNVGAY